MSPNSACQEKWYRSLGHTVPLLTLLLVLAALFSPAAHAQTTPTVDALYQFNGNILDSSGYGNNLNYYGAGVMAYASETVNGVTQRVANFNYSGGESGFVQLGIDGFPVNSGVAAPVNLPLAGNSAWTMNMWLNPNVPINSSWNGWMMEIGGFGAYWHQAGDGGNRSMSAYVGNPTGAWNAYFWGWGADCAGQGPYTPNEWNMYTVTYDGAGTLNMYRNGQPWGQSTGNVLVDCPNWIYIAAGADPWYNGKMANFSIWTGAMDATQLASLYAHPTTNVANGAYWTGAATNEWSTAAIVSPKNWTSGGVAADYSDGSDVVFDDTATRSTIDIKSANVTPNSVTFNCNMVNYTLGSSDGHGIAGPTTLMKNGNGALTVSSTNSYTGGTMINGGLLNFATADSLPSTGNIFINAGGAVGVATSVAYPNAAALLSRIVPTSGGALALTADDGTDLDLSGYTNLYLGSVGDRTYSGNLTPGSNGYLLGGGSGNLTVTGALTSDTALLTIGGRVTLAGADHTVSAVSVSSGVLTITSGTLTTSADCGINSKWVGVSNTSYLVMTGGTWNQTAWGLHIGADWGNDYGVVDLSGNAVLSVLGGGNEGNNGNGNSNSIMVGQAGHGTMLIRGQTQVTSATNFTIGLGHNANPPTNSSTGMVVVADQAQLTSSYRIDIGGHYGAATGVLNQTGGTITANWGMSFGRGGGNGTYNLNGGMVIVPGFGKESGSGTINLNGGTIRASADNGAFLQGFNAVNVYGGGVTFDTNGRSITVAQSLLGTTGIGLPIGAVASLDGGTTTYNVVPDVTFTGNAAIPATGYATLDPVTGRINGVYVTSPGSGYTSAPTVNFSGGVVKAGGTPPAASVTLTGMDNAQGGLTKIGSGTLTLAGPNMYSGLTTIDAGILVAASPAAMPNWSTAGKVVLAPAATLAVRTGGAGEWSDALVTAVQRSTSIFDAANKDFGIEVIGPNNVTYGTAINDINGTRGFAKLGAGTLVLTGANTYTGLTTVNAGVLQIGTGGAISPITTSGFTGNGTLTFNHSDNQSLSGVINMGGSLTHAGTGTLTIGGDNALGAGFSVLSGVLKLTDGTTTVTGSTDCGVTAPGAFLMTGGALNLNTDNTYGAGCLAMDGGGVVDISGGNLTVTGRNFNNPAGSSLMIGVGSAGTMFIGGDATVATNHHITMGVVSGGNTGMLVVSDNALVTTNEAVIVGGSQAASTGILTQTGGTITSTYQFVITSVGGSVGTYNFNGGVVVAPFFDHGGASSTLNLNGGTIRASATGAGPGGVFMQGLTAANVYAGGVTFDTSGNSITVGQNLVGAAGSGLAIQEVTAGLPTTTYTFAPTVTFSGGSGAGATGYAKLDPATGTVSGVYISNPGSDYTSTPTIVLNGVDTGVTAALGASNALGGLTKNGDGMLTLSGSNSYGGGTTVSAGTLVAASPAALPNWTTAGKVVLSPNTTLAVRTGGAGEWADAQMTALQQSTSIFDAANKNFGIEVIGANSATYDTPIDDINGTRGFAKLGAGTLVLTGANTYTGPTTISAGVLQIGAGGPIAPIVTPSFAGNGSLTFNHSDSMSFSGGINIGGRFTQQGTGMLTIGGDNALGAGFNVPSGVLKLIDGTTTVTGATDCNATGSGAFLMTGGTLTLDTDFQQAGCLSMDSGGVVDVSGGTLVVKGRNMPNDLGSSLMIGTWTGGRMFIGGNAVVTTNHHITMGVAYDGRENTGMLVVSGGQVTTNQSVVVGGSQGAASGILNQSGGTVTSTWPMCLGYQGGSTGTYNLNGGTVVAPAIVQNGGSGTLNLNSGTIRASASDGVVIPGFPAIPVFMPGLAAATVYAGGVTFDTNGNDITVGQSLVGATGTGLAIQAVTAGLGATTYSVPPAVTFSGGGGAGATGYAKLDLATGTVSGVYISNPGSDYTSTPTIVLDGVDTGVTAALGSSNESGGLTKSGDGILTLTGSNSYGGGTTVSAGTLQLGSGTALGASAGSLAINAGALDMNGFSATVGKLSGAGSIQSTAAGAVLTTSFDAGSSTFAGPIIDGGGTLGLVKSGSGTLVLSGTNDYSGGTLVSEGILRIAGANALPVGRGLTIEEGGTVVLASGLSAAGTTAATAVPEPNALLLLVMAALCGLAVLHPKRG